MNKYCQTNEEDILASIFNSIGVTNRYCVEFGAGRDGYLYSNTRRLMNYYGWKGLMMDAAAIDGSDVKKEFITAENIVSLFRKYRVAHVPDLLSIDLDGSDIWVLGALLESYKPRVIVAEFNPAIPIGESKAMKYNPNHSWGNDDYYGASFEAFKVLGVNYGYRIVNNNGLNLFMVRSDIHHPDINITYTERHDHAPSTKGEWVEYK